MLDFEEKLIENSAHNADEVFMCPELKVKRAPASLVMQAASEVHEYIRYPATFAGSALSSTSPSPLTTSS